MVENILTNTRNFEELRRVYSECFSLGYIKGNNGRSPIENRFVLISLICLVTYKAKEKNPDVNHYQIIMKLSKNLGLPDEFIRGLAIICEDFSYGCTDFPNFNLKGKDILNEIINILKCYLPF